MSAGKVSLSYPEPFIGVISIHDEEGKNTLTPPFVSALEAAIDTIGQHASTKVIIFKGTSEIFCAGADRPTLVNLVNGAT